MRDLEYKDGLKCNGYSQEEAYFYQLNHELIQKLKRKFGKSSSTETDETQAKEKEHSSEDYSKAA